MARDPLPDALRAVALLGVLLVNAVGYPEAPAGALLGHAARSVADSVVQFLLASFVQGKAYPLLAMLFGMGLVWAARGRSRVQAYARFGHRQRRLLALGVAHGCLIYFGDILTLYCVAAWSVWSTVHARWPVVLRRLKRALGWALLAMGGTLLLAWFAPPWEEGQVPTLRRAETVLEFLKLNASVYATSNFFGLLLALPVVRLCMLAGIVAARLGLLTHRRWQPWRDAVNRRRWLWPVLAANVAYGSSVALSMSRSGEHLMWADAASPLVGLALAACIALMLSRLWDRGHRRWAHALAPLGRRTLSVYVGLSLLCVALFSGIGLAWAPGTPVVALLALALWLVLAWTAALSQRRWPLEWWMGRRSREPDGAFS